jgi:hypothetical protein
MIASARFEMDEKYFRESYDEWLRYGSRVRRLQPWLGLFSVFLGIGLHLFDAKFRSTAFILVVFGLLQVFENYFYRRNYLKARVDARGKNENLEISMQFDVEGILQTGPTSTGKMKWAAVKGLRETPRGICLAIGDGMSIYIPKAAITPSTAIPEIIVLARSGA